MIPKILLKLCSGNLTPTQHLEEQQAIVKQFAAILEFALKFDEYKVRLFPYGKISKSCWIDFLFSGSDTSNSKWFKFLPSSNMPIKATFNSWRKPREFESPSELWVSQSYDTVFCWEQSYAHRFKKCHHEMHRWRKLKSSRWIANK